MFIRNSCRQPVLYKFLQNGLLLKGPDLIDQRVGLFRSFNAICFKTFNFNLEFFTSIKFSHGKQYSRCNRVLSQHGDDASQSKSSGRLVQLSTPLFCGFTIPLRCVPLFLTVLCSISLKWAQLKCKTGIKNVGLCRLHTCGKMSKKDLYKKI